MRYEILLLNFTFVLVFSFTILLIFYFYFSSRRRRIMFPSGTSVWSFWHIHTTPAVRKEFVASRMHALTASLSEMQSTGSLKKMRLSLENASDELLQLFLDVTPSLGCEVHIETRRLSLEGRASAEIIFDVRILSGNQSITVHVKSEEGESLFYATHTFFSRKVTDAKGYLEVLGLSEGATKTEIRKKRRELAKRYHPDKEATKKDKEAALEKMKEINRAYAALKEMGCV